MDNSSSKPPKHHNSKSGASGSTDRQNVDPSQSGPPVAKKGAHTSARHDGAFAAEGSSNPEVIALEWQMQQMSIARSPPSGPIGTVKTKSQSSGTQSQTRRRSEVQAQLVPAPYAQGLPVATATSDHRHPQPRIQTNQSTLGQPQQVSHVQKQQVSHVQKHQMPHGQVQQVSHGQAHQVQHGQMSQLSHGPTHYAPQTHQIQAHPVSHGQAHQMPHGHSHHAPHGQMLAPQGPTYQPAQVQMPRATEGGTSSHDQQRSTDRRGRHDHMPAVTANQRTTASSSRR